MFTKTKTALALALVLSTASAAFAVDVTADAEKDRGLQTYQQMFAAPQGHLIEGRNVGVGAPYSVPSDEEHWYERSAIDFNS